VTKLIDKIWATYDRDKSGTLEIAELHRFLSEFYSDAGLDSMVFEFEVQDLIDEIDKSGDGIIQKDELVKFMCFCYGIQYREKPNNN
jgi:Ca2+-binding EF-hand superfamily protein